MIIIVNFSQIDAEELDFQGVVITLRCNDVTIFQTNQTKEVCIEGRVGCGSGHM